MAPSVANVGVLPGKKEALFLLQTVQSLFRHFVNSFPALGRLQAITDFTPAQVPSEMMMNKRALGYSLE